MKNLTEQLKYMMTESFREEHTTKGTTNSLSPNDVCPICKNTGWEIYQKEGKSIARECRCGIRKKEIHNRRLRFAGIPVSFSGVRLDNFKKSVYKQKISQDMIVEAAKAVRYWLQNFDEMKERGIGLYFYSGTKGSGKTRLAVSVANELVFKHETRVEFSTSIQILQEIKKSWDEKNNSESILLDSLSKVDVLVIDDFGTENLREWIDEKFYSIINERYIDKKITIYTSNFRLDDLKYDERITNRIKERVLQIPFPEESVRETLAKELREELIKNISQ